MRNWLIIGIALLWGFRVSAQPYAALDGHARSVLFSDQDNLTSLVGKLIAPAKTDYEKVRVLFVWTATNICYDDRLVRSYQYGFVVKSIDTLTVVTQVIRRQWGVCSDYALVLCQLLRLAGLPAQMVQGYAKGHFDQAGVAVKSINHQWNLVQLNGRWQPLDATWASPNGGIRSFNWHYFLTPWAQFAADHLAINPVDGELGRSFQKAEFDSLPRVYSTYFELGFKPDFPRQGLYQINRKLGLFLGVQKPMEFLVVANRYGQPAREHPVYYRTFRQPDGYEVFLQVFREGLYSVHVLARQQGTARDFEPILTYTVVNKR